jgi:hypothetical protein
MKYHLFHTIRAEFLLELGRNAQARAAELRAITLTDNQAEQGLLHQRLSRLGLAEGIVRRRRNFLLHLPPTARGSRKSAKSRAVRGEMDSPW